MPNKQVDDVELLFGKAIEAAKQFTLVEEFPGPYTLQVSFHSYRILSKAGDIVVTTKYQDFADFMLHMLNATHMQLAV